MLAGNYIGLLQGNEFTAELWEQIVIPFTVIGYRPNPSEIQITLDGNPPPLEFTSEYFSDTFSGRINISRALLSMTGSYDVTFRGNDFPIRINVLGMFA